MNMPIAIFLLVLLVLQSFTGGKTKRRPIKETVKTTANLLRNHLSCLDPKLHPVWLRNKNIKRSCDTEPGIQYGSVENRRCNYWNQPVLNLTCDAGYFLPDGTTHRIISCTGEDNTWLGTEDCRALHCAAPYIENADIPVGPYLYGNQITVACNTGYTSSDGSQNYTSGCTADGSWTRTDPCRPIICLGIMQNNTKLLGGQLPDISYPSGLTVHCADGHQTGTGETSYDMFCTASGIWTTASQCTLKACSCGKRYLMKTGDHLPVTDQYGTVTVVCAFGEMLPGGTDTSYNATCNTGEWSRTDSCGTTTCGTALGDGLPSGVYTISPDGTNMMDVYCELDTSVDGGGWTVIQQRVSAAQDFFLDWQAYKKGFGDKTANFWLGNDNIHLLTRGQNTKLRIEMAPGYDCAKTVYAEYSNFYIEDEENNYRLHIGTYSGTAGDAMTFHNGMEFSTKDEDNDTADLNNCAEYWVGAWWFGNCFNAHLNGQYGGYDNYNGIVWGLLTEKPLPFVRMMVKANEGN